MTSAGLSSTPIFCYSPSENVPISNDNQMQVKCMAQKVELDRMCEERNRWIQISSRLYDICSQQILDEQ
jgi:hypothetical protein